MNSNQLLVVILLAISGLTACGSDSGESNTNITPDTTTPTVPTTPDPTAPTEPTTPDPTTPTEPTTPDPTTPTEPTTPDPTTPTEPTTPDPTTPTEPTTPDPDDKAKIANNSFEQWTDNKPAYWDILKEGPTGISVSKNTDASIIKEGEASLKITVNTTTQANTDFSQNVTVEKGNIYNFSAWVYHTKGGVRARSLIRHDSTNTYSYYTDPDLVDQWQELKWKEYTAEKTETIKLTMRFYDISGSFKDQEDVYLDNISVDIKKSGVVEPPKPTEPTEPTSPTSNGSDFTCETHLQQGVPSNDTQLCRKGYVVGFDTAVTPSKKVAEWVAYHVTKASVNLQFERSDNFRPDPELPIDDQAQLADYSGNGYDRGHLAPAATMDFSESSMEESFLMSNMAPQIAGLNRGGWKGLEDRVRIWANLSGELDIVAGPIWDNANSEKKIGNGVYVPNKFYKVILDAKSQKALAFIFPHQKISTSDLATYITTVDEVELQTGLDFFSKLPDDVEDNIESVASAIWDLE